MGNGNFGRLGYEMTCSRVHPQNPSADIIISPIRQCSTQSLEYTFIAGPETVIVAEPAPIAESAAAAVGFEGRAEDDDALAAGSW